MGNPTLAWAQLFDFTTIRPCLDCGLRHSLARTCKETRAAKENHDATYEG